MVPPAGSWCIFYLNFLLTIFYFLFYSPPLMHRPRSFIHVNDLTHWHSWDDSFMYAIHVTWCVHIIVEAEFVLWESTLTQTTLLSLTYTHPCIHVLEVIHICDVTHSHMCQRMCWIYVTWNDIRTWPMFFLIKCQRLCLRYTVTCAMTHSHNGNALCIMDQRMCLRYVCAMRRHSCMGNVFFWSARKCV